MQRFFLRLQDTLRAGGSVIAVFKMANDSEKTMRQWRGCFLGAESFSLLYDAPPPLLAIVEVAL